MDFFIDRRDISPKGLKRREIFGKMLVLLEQKGLSSNTARAELKGVMDGRHSDLLESLGIRLTTKQT